MFSFSMATYILLYSTVEFYISSIFCIIKLFIRQPKECSMNEHTNVIQNRNNNNNEISTSATILGYKWIPTFCLLMLSFEFRLDCSHCLSRSLSA